MAGAFQKDAFQNDAFQVEAGAAGVSISLAGLEGADTAAAGIGLAISASLASTEGADTASSNVVLFIQAAVAGLEGADRAAVAMDAVPDAATFALASTDGADTASVRFSTPDNAYTGGWSHVWRRREREKLTTDGTRSPEPEVVAVMPRRAVGHARWMPARAESLPVPKRISAQRAVDKQHHDHALRLLLLAS